MSQDARHFPSEDALVSECDLDEPPEKVWRALTDPRLLARWLMPNDIRAEVGRRFTLRAGPEAGGDIACEVLAVEPHRLLRVSWRAGEPDGRTRTLDTVVTFELSRTTTGGTHLRVVHSGFSRSVKPVARNMSAQAPAMPAGRRRPVLRLSSRRTMPAVRACARPRLRAAA